MRPLPLMIAAAGSLAAPAVAADLTVTFELPTIRTAAYHRPYVAVWIEQDDEATTAVRTIALWYEAGETARGDGTGEDYLKDLRLWWREGGRSMTLPISGITGPTQAPGAKTVRMRGLAGLPAGRYNVVVEAAREQGGREVVRVPFTWGGAANTARAAGTTELGAVSVAVTR